MAQEYTVKLAQRKAKRDVNKIFLNDFFKIITEILLNSDDSYKRLEDAKTSDEVKHIKLHLDRHKKSVEIIDYAEGLDAEAMRRIFTEYGAQHNLGRSEVRGLFGQGASDVLFYSAVNAKQGEIKSIKDGALHVCKFIFRDEKIIKINTIFKKQQLKAFKDKYGIEENGTVVSFGLGKKVHLPKPNVTKERIEQFYMLRPLLSNPLRNVVLIEGNDIQPLSSGHLDYDEADKLIKQTFSFTYQEHTLNGMIELYEDHQNDVEEKILVLDDKNRVYDFTFFGLQEMSGVGRIRGKMIIHNLYEVLTEYLNRDEPEEVLKDSRDGFDMRHEFYRRLATSVKPFIGRQIEAINQRYEPKSYNLEGDERLRSMLRRINDYYRELKLEDIGNLTAGTLPPGEGLLFVRPLIYLTQKRQYDLKLLINPTMIPVNQIIKITVSEPEIILIKNQSITYQEEDIDERGLVTKSIVLSGLHITKQPITIKAHYEGLETNVLAHVVKEEVIYPKNGLEFIPKEMSVLPHKSKTIKLYVDTSKYPIGTEIALERHTKRELFAEQWMLVLDHKHLRNEVLACLEIHFSGDILGSTHRYVAWVKETQTECVVKIEDRSNKEKGLQGLLSGLEAESDPNASWQSTFSASSGKVKVNLKHPINEHFLKGLTSERLKALKFDEQHYLYLYELICQACAKQIISIKRERHEIPDDHETILEAMQKFKTEMFKTSMG